MAQPAKKFDSKMEVLYRDTEGTPGPSTPLWRTGIIADGKPKAPTFCNRRNRWMYPVIITDRPMGPRILQWVREDAISGCIQPRRRARTEGML